ncbi:MAG: hypothetical protein IT285_04545 [Bdellovibrionales bacterium]|nr:hypothetical protein [Bdellovibrionales bacterium]
MKRGVMRPLPQFSLWVCVLALAAAGPVTVARAAGEVSNVEVCQSAKDRFFSDSDVIVQCREKYHHYNAGAVTAHYKARKNREFKLGSFNMFHLGDNQSRYKDYSVMAQIINQWDVVAAIEVQPLPTAEAKRNDDLAEFLAVVEQSETEITSADGRPVTAERIYGDMTPPGYVKLLKSLMELDPSWSLIIAAEPAGEGTHKELSGFYYRAQNVKPKRVTGCANQMGCVAQIPNDMKVAVAREPFIAGFQSGPFDFIGMALHARFREPPQASAMAAIRRIFDGVALGVRPNEEVARFAEVKAVLKVAGSLARGAEKDVIVAGDFNLTLKPGFTSAWEHVLEGLPGSQVFVNQPTSVSKMNGLANEYDHFIANVERTAECSVAEASSFNFLDAETAPMVQEAIAGLSRYRRSYETAMRSAYMPKSNRHYVPVYKEDQIDQMMADFDRRLVDSQSDESNDFLVYVELVSDHIPIEMTCNTGARDDD